MASRVVLIQFAILLTLTACSEQPTPLVGAGPPDDRVFEGDAFVATKSDVVDLLPYVRVTGDLVIVPEFDLAGAELPALQRVDGSVRLDGLGQRNVTWTLALPALVSIGHGLSAQGSDELVELDMPALEDIAGQISFKNGKFRMYAPSLRQVGGSLRALDATLASLELWALEQVGGSLDLRRFTVGPGQSQPLPLPALREVGDDVLLQDGSETTLDAPSLERVGGDVELSRMRGALLLPALVEVGGSVRIDAAELRAVELPALTMVGGRLEVRETELDDGVDLLLPSLERVGHRIDLSGVGGVEELRLPALAQVGTAIRVELCNHLAVIELDALTAVPSDFEVSGNPRVEVLLHAMTRVGGSLMVRGNGGLALHAPLLEQVVGSLELDSTPLEVLELDQVVAVGRDLVLRDCRFQAADPLLPALVAVGGDVVVESVDLLAAVSLPALERVGQPEVDDQVGSFLVRGNLDLAALTLPALTSIVRDVAVLQNPALPSVLATYAFDGVTIGGELRVCENENAEPACE